VDINTREFVSEKKDNEKTVVDIRQRISPLMQGGPEIPVDILFRFPKQTGIRRVQKMVNVL